VVLQNRINESLAEREKEREVMRHREEIWAAETMEIRKKEKEREKEV
jgi:hypothetical protein